MEASRLMNSYVPLLSDLLVLNFTKRGTNSHSRCSICIHAERSITSEISLRMAA